MTAQTKGEIKIWASVLVGSLSLAAGVGRNEMPATPYLDKFFAVPA